MLPKTEKLQSADRINRPTRFQLFSVPFPDTSTTCSNNGQRFRNEALKHLKTFPGQTTHPDSLIVSLHSYVAGISSSSRFKRFRNNSCLFVAVAPNPEAAVAIEFELGNLAALSAYDEAGHWASLHALSPTWAWLKGSKPRAKQFNNRTEQRAVHFYEPVELNFSATSESPNGSDSLVALDSLRPGHVELSITDREWSDRKADDAGLGKRSMHFDAMSSTTSGAPPYEINFNTRRQLDSQNRRSANSV
jgi:hypothetical protein